MCCLKLLVSSFCSGFSCVVFCGLVFFCLVVFFLFGAFGFCWWRCIYLFLGFAGVLLILFFCLVFLVTCLWLFSFIVFSFFLCLCFFPQ